MHYRVVILGIFGLSLLTSAAIAQEQSQRPASQPANVMPDKEKIIDDAVKGLLQDFGRIATLSEKQKLLIEQTLETHIRPLVTKHIDTAIRFNQLDRGAQPPTAEEMVEPAKAMLRFMDEGQTCFESIEEDMSRFLTATQQEEIGFFLDKSFLDMNSGRTMIERMANGEYDPDRQSNRVPQNGGQAT